MLKAIKVILYPSQDQEDYIANLLGCCRFAYNSCLDYKIKIYNETKENVSFGQISKHLVKLKQNEETSWLKNASDLNSVSEVNWESFLELDENSTPKFNSLSIENTDLDKEGSIVIGNQNQNSNIGSINIGIVNNTISGGINGSTIFGNLGVCTLQGENTIAIGKDNSISSGPSDYSSAFGYRTKTTIDNTAEIGYWQSSTRTSAIRMHPDKQVAISIQSLSLGNLS